MGMNVYWEGHQHQRVTTVNEPWGHCSFTTRCTPQQTGSFKPYNARDQNFLGRGDNDNAPQPRRRPQCSICPVGGFAPNKSVGQQAYPALGGLVTTRNYVRTTVLY